MTIAVPILIFTVIFIMALLKPQSHFVTAIASVYIFVMIGFNTFSIDLPNYRISFEALQEGRDSGISEVGYRFFYKVCADIGLSFSQTQVVYALLFTALLNFSVYSYTRYTAFAVALFAVFPFMHYIIVLRSGLAAVVIFASASRFVKGKRFGLFFMMFGMIIAFCVHYSAVFFAVMLLATNKKNYKMKWLVSVGIAVVYIAFNSPILNKLCKLIGINKPWLMDNNIEAKLNIVGQMAVLFILVGNLFLMWKANRFFEKSKHEIEGIFTREEIDSFDRLSTFTSNLNLFVLLLIPLLFYSDVYMRVVYTILPFNYCTWANVFRIKGTREDESSLISNKHVQLAFWVVVCWVFLLFMYSEYIYIGTETSKFLMFKNNSIFGLLNLQ